MSLVRAFGTGAAGEHVRDLQRRLAGLGYHPGAADGTFASLTTEAVREFQLSRGLDVDGICGPDTWAALVEAGHGLGDRLLYLASPMFRGDDVGELQQLLATFGFDPGRVDSVLGPETANALSEFQRNTGLVMDGIGGPESIRMFTRLTPPHPPAGATVSAVRESERLRAGPPTLAGRRVVIGEAGGLGAVAAAIHRVLGELGANVVTFHHPNWAYQASQANAFDADAFIGIVVRSDDERSVCFFSTDRSESLAGRELASALATALTPIVGTTDPKGMRLPVLRATKMPAVVCRLGNVRDLVPRTPAVARGVRDALKSWIEESC